MMKKLMEKVRMIRENQKKNGTKGFSMIELIIVIAIMAILVALIGTQLLPYLEKSRLSKDTSNLDSALSSFQTAIVEAEENAVGQTYTFNTTLDGTAVGQAFTTYAGFKPSELSGMMKSKDCKGQTVTVSADNNGSLTLTCGTVKLTPKGNASSSAAPAQGGQQGNGN